MIKMKKVGAIIVVVAMILIIILGSLYIIDTNNMKNNKPVVFSTWGKKYTPPDTENLWKSNRVKTKLYYSRAK